MLSRRFLQWHRNRDIPICRAGCLRMKIGAVSPGASVCKRRQASSVWVCPEHQVCPWCWPNHQAERRGSQRTANLRHREVGYRHNWSLPSVQAEQVEHCNNVLQIAQDVEKNGSMGWFWHSLGCDAFVYTTDSHPWNRLTLGSFLNEAFAKSLMVCKSG